MRAAGARLDAYAHHPYPLRPRSTRRSPAAARWRCETITMATLERLLARGALRVAGEADLADRVRLPDEPARPHDPRRLVCAAGPLHRRGGAQGLAGAAQSTCSIHFLVQDDAVPRRLAERALHGRGESRSRPRARSRCRSRRCGDGATGCACGARSGRATASSPFGSRIWRGSPLAPGRRPAADERARRVLGDRARGGGRVRPGVVAARRRVRAAAADPLARERREHDDRDDDQHDDDREPHHPERSAFARAGPRLGRVRVERRRRLARRIVLALEHLRLVLDLALGHGRDLPRLYDSETEREQRRITVVAVRRKEAGCASSSRSQASSRSPCSSCPPIPRERR